ncbi:H-NS family nucleoid-associated regulatory protein [Cupriavidus sp. CP313]
MNAYLDLERRFGLITHYSPDALVAVEAAGKRLTWTQVLSGRFSIIVARANFGKTTELQAQAQLLRAQGKHAVFVALHNVLAQEPFAEALFAEDDKAFEKWQRTPQEELILFVDSLDEASLSRENGVRVGLRRVARACSGPGVNLRWVISSRPAVLTPNVLSAIETELGTTLFVSEGSSADNDWAAVFDDADAQGDSDASKAGESSQAGEGPGAMGGNQPADPEQLKTYALLPLDVASAKRFLKERCGVADPGALLGGARSYGLGGLRDGPGGLDVLAHVDPVNRPPATLTEVFNRMVAAVEQLQRADPREQRMSNPVPAKFEEAVQKLAAASALCLLPNIELSEDPLRSDSSVLSARQIVGNLVSDQSLKLILGSRLFIDSGPHQVKLYPDELLPFLAAKRLASLVRSPEEGVRLVQSLSWTAPTGEKGVCRKYLTTAGWLATLSAHCRHALLQIDPQAVAFFGDLRHLDVPLSDAIAALSESIRNLAEEADSLGRGHFTLTPENYWQASKPGLESTLQALFQRYGDDWRARDALLSIGSYGRNEALRADVIAAHGGDYTTLLRHSGDLHYIASLERTDDAAGLATALLATSALREDVVALLLPFLAWKTLDATQLADLVDRQLRTGKGGFRIEWALDNDVVEGATPEQLLALARAVVRRMIRRSGTPDRKRQRCTERYVELGLKLVAHVVTRGDEIGASRATRLCLAMNMLVEAQFHGSVDANDLTKALTNNGPVRLALLRALIRRACGSPDQIMRMIFGYRPLCPVVDGDERAIADPAFSEVLARLRNNAKPTNQLRPPRRRGRSVVVSPELKSRLVAEIDQIRDGTALQELADVAELLIQTDATTAYSSCDFAAFEHDVGIESANAVRSGFGKLWRARQPSWDETKPNHTRHITIAGLQGLQLELGDGARLPPLTPREVRQALRYGRFEIDGYPAWFWPLALAHEAIAIAELVDVIANAKAGAVSLGHAETLIRSLDHASVAIQQGVSAAVWHFVLEHTDLPDYVVEAALRLATVSVQNDSDSFETAAWLRIEGAFRDSLPVVPDESSLDGSEEARNARQQLEEQLWYLRRRRATAVAWGASWLTWFPGSFRHQWLQWRSNAARPADDFLYDLAAMLGQGRVQLGAIADRGSEGLETLRVLYEQLQVLVCHEQDADHSDGEVYRVSERDHAQRLRDAIPPVLAEAQEQEAYDILEALRRATKGNRAKYLRNLQWQMQENRFSLAPLPQHEYGRFETDFAPAVSTYTSFAMAVYTDLLTVKYQIEQGEFSLRRFFSSVSYESIKTDADRLALEEDFQALLGSELNHVARHRYAVTLESQLPEATRRDLLCRAGSFYASVELKLSKRWTLSDYLESLEGQLVGQYMRARNSRIGFFVLVLQEQRTWAGLNPGEQLDFHGLIAQLSERAQQLEAGDRTLYLRVVGIDATPPDNFRQERTRTGAARRKPPKYGDGSGKTWSGYGKRPRWLNEALASGKTLEDLRLPEPTESTIVSRTVVQTEQRKDQES